MDMWGLQAAMAQLVGAPPWSPQLGVLAMEYPFLSLAVQQFWALGYLAGMCVYAAPLRTCSLGRPHTVGLQMGENLFSQGCLLRVLACFKARYDFSSGGKE